MDDWRSAAGERELAARAGLLRRIREYFHCQGVVEVTTPTLGRSGVSDPGIENIRVGEHLFLQTSPEFAMKRLIASGSGSIYQIGPAYRGGETGRRHNVEFTMLEWYRVGYDLEQLAGDVQALFRFLCESGTGLPEDFRELRRVSYESLFRECFGVDPHRAALEDLRSLVRGMDLDTQHIGEPEDEGTRPDILDLLFSTEIEPGLIHPVIVSGYPACQAALAEVKEAGGVLTAMRFEVFAGGMEIANGYQELRNADELRRRTDRNNAIRRARHLEPVEVDARFLAAMEMLPECAGIAMGIERLLMILCGTEDIGQVMTFPWNRL